MTSPRETASDIAGALRGAAGEPVFAVGDRVRVVGGVRHCIGRDDGVIGLVDCVDDLPYRVDFLGNHHGSWWFGPFDLERLPVSTETPRECDRCQNEAPITVALCDHETPRETAWREGDAIEVRPCGTQTPWRAARITKIEPGARWEARGKYESDGSIWEVDTVADLDDPSVFRRPLAAETPREPDSLTVFGYECRRTYPATWRADAGLPSALSIVVRRWPSSVHPGLYPAGISVSVYQSATCLASAEASTVGDAEAACGMRLGQAVDAIRQLLTHGGE